METLKKDMQRVRRQYVKYNKAPKTSEYIEYPEDCKYPHYYIPMCNHKDSTLECKKQFLAFDSDVDDPERILAFGTKNNINRLKRCTHGGSTY